MLNYENGQDNKILKCLAYMDMQQYEQAHEIARGALEVGDRGNFENKGLGFFEWLLLD